MKRANVIIGAAFGDEGKGLMTDYLVRQNDPTETTVVRFNGGANAGHTVVTPEGQRHVFHHYGSGTLAGAKTFLSRYFLVNPVLWKIEFDELTAKGITPPKILIDRMAPLTTVYDMLVNQAIETQRGEHRHGSCGAGVHQTMLRQRDPVFRLSSAALTRPIYLRDKVNMIRKRHADLPDFQSEEIFERFLKDCALLVEQIEFCDSIAHAKNIVFEGAQGLLLDSENKMFFPHVTHSRTGLTNVIPLTQEANIDHLDVTYVMRSYLTRHGAGELPGEQNYYAVKFDDDTNVDNPWQGPLRFAPLDAELIQDAILDDLEDTSVTPNIAVTHVDQCPFHLDGSSFQNFPIPVRYFSLGPTYKDVHKC